VAATSFDSAAWWYTVPPVPDCSHIHAPKFKLSFARLAGFQAAFILHWGHTHFAMSRSRQVYYTTLLPPSHFCLAFFQFRPCLLDSPVIQQHYKMYNNSLPLQLFRMQLKYGSALFTQDLPGFSIHCPSNSW
jgi:hypothetical protein